MESERRNKVLKRIKMRLVLIYTSIMVFMCTLPALAGIEVQTAETFQDKLIGVVEAYGIPIGGGILLICVCVLGIKMMTGSFNSQKREETMGAFPYVIGGAVLFGGGLFFAGILLGIGQMFQG